MTTKTLKLTVICLFLLVASLLGWPASDPRPCVELAVLRGTAAAPAPPACADAPPVRTAVDEVTGFWGAPVGSAFAWRFEHACRYGLETEAGAAGTDVTLGLAGTLHMQVLERTDEVVRVAVQCRDVTPHAPPIDAEQTRTIESYRAALEAWCLVAIDPRGTVQGFAFQDACSPRQRMVARGVIAGLFHTIPEAPPAAWTARESDSLGTFDARYRVVARDAERTRIERTRGDYVDVAVRSRGRIDARPECELAGGSRAEFPHHDHWIGDVVVDETAVIAMDVMECRARVRVQAAFTRVDAAWPGFELDRADWPPFGSATGSEDDLGPEDAADERAAWAARVERSNLDTLLADVMSLHARGASDSAEFFETWTLLGWKLRLDPASVAAAERLLLAAQLQERTAGSLLTALAVAGTPEAQQVLLAVRDSVHLPESMRSRAVAAMFGVTEPSRALLESAAARVRALHTVDAKSATDLLLLGALAGRSGERLSGGESALRELLALETAAADERTLAVWLDALGNAAAPAAAAAAARYLGDPRAPIRARAVRALGRAGADGSAPLLARVATSDPDRGVRLRAVDALGQHREGRAPLRELAAGAPDPRVREGARSVLGRAGFEPATSTL